jgi:hypothetical protein
MTIGFGNGAQVRAGSFAVGFRGLMIVTHRDAYLLLIYLNEVQMDARHTTHWRQTGDDASIALRKPAYVINNLHKCRFVRFSLKDYHGRSTLQLHPDFSRRQTKKSR